MAVLTGPDSAGPDSEGASPPRLPPRPPVAQARFSPASRIAVVAVVIAAAVLAYVLTRPSDYSYRLDFHDAGQLVPGDLVRIGGVQAGTIKSLRLTDHGLAQVAISLDRSYGPLRDGTTAQIRSPGLGSVASRYIDISPAPTFKPALASDAVVPTSATAGIVDIDQLFNSLNANTRTGLRRLIRGFGQWYQGKSAQANLTASYFPPALQSYTRLFDQIDASSGTLHRFIGQTSRALQTIDAHSSQLTNLISGADVTAQALSSDNRSLSEGLTQLPGAFRKGSATFKELRTQALPALTRLVNATRPATGPLAQFLPKLDPVLQAAVPTFAQLRQTLDKPGPDNDLLDALVKLPKLATAVSQDFPVARKALHEGTPDIKYGRPYVPDLVAWLVNWDGIFATYDANGHYARTEPVFGAFGLNAKGTKLTQISPAKRGTGPDISHGNLARCPGGGIPSPPDKSAPFVDRGSQSNANCKPSESVGG